MRRSFAFLTFIIFIAFSSISHAGWLESGSYGGDDQIWLDDKIKPVSNGGDPYPWMYTLSYKISLQDSGYIYTNYIVDLKSRKTAQLQGKTEMLTLSNRNIYIDEVESIWGSDPSGFNNWTFAAYLWKNHEKIDKQKPILLPENLRSGLTNSKEQWAADAQGWLQVYAKTNGQKAWIQTKSISFVQEPNASIPSVQLLVRWEEPRGEQSAISYSLEQYSIPERTRTFLYVWKEGPTDKTPTIANLPVKPIHPAQVPDKTTTIATAAYVFDLLHGKRTPLSPHFPTLTKEEIEADWLHFTP